MDKENVPASGNLMMFSPPAKALRPAAAAPGTAAAALPSLITARFQKALSIEFGNVAVHATSTQRFRLINPNDNKSITVAVEKVAADKGFSVILGDGDTVVIPAGESAIGMVRWTPSQDMSVACTVSLKLNDNSPLQLTLRGKAGTGQAPSGPAEKVDFATKRKALAAIADNSNRDNENSLRRQFKPIVPAKQQQMQLQQQQQQQQQSSGSFKKMYDDKWADKQIESFTEWINFTLSQTGASPDDDEASSSSAGAGLRLLMQRRMEAQIRQRAMLIFHSSQVAVPLFALGEEICDGRMMVREDRNVHADLGLQELLLGLLFSYELPWLRLGLEVVFGQIISFKAAAGDVPCKPGNAKWKKLLKTFIFEHLFADADIQAKPQYSQQKLLYVKNQDALKEELRAHLVKKFLALVLVLDMAREQRLLSLPTLFVNASPESVKSSKEVLLSFCKEFLRGEGDFIRHLGLMGYNVSFQQSYTDEFNYSVTNLAVDLRDGVRLTRLVEVLTKSNDLSAHLRVPAVSLMQKIHNVKLAMDKIYTSKSDAEPKAIVEGHRDSTLLLLWKLMFNFELKMLIDPARVRKEAAAIRQNQAWRRSVYDAAEAGSFAVTVPVVDAKGAVTFPPALPPSTQEAPQPGPCGIKGMDDSTLAAALLEWCDAVASQYGVPVYNLSSCLADGRALCLLVHYYHPSILPTKVIKKTTQNIAAAFSSNTSLDAYTESCIDVPKQEVRRALDGERRNFSTLKKACGDIGGIPSMLSLYDSNNVPEAKTMTIFLGYLFARLIESSEQVRSAIRIQRAFRRAAPELRRSLCAKEQAKGGKAKMAIARAAQTNSSSTSRREVDNVVTDVCVTVVMSSHRAASIVQRAARMFRARKVMTQLRKTWVAEQAMLAAQQAEEERQIREAEEKEAQLAAFEAEEEARVAAEETARLEQEEAARLYAIERERLLQEEAIQEQSRLMEMHEETALRALEEAEAARAEKEAADAEREQALQEAEEARAEAEAEADRRAELEQKLSQYEDAQHAAEQEAMALERVRIELEEQVAAGSMTHAALLAQLELEQAAKLAAEAEARTKYEELAALDAQLAEEKLASAQAVALEREAELARMAQEKMEAAVRAEKEAREAAEAQARSEAEQRQALEERIKELEASRDWELAQAQQAERARVETEMRLAAELATKVEAARIAAQEEAQRKLDEEAAAAAAAVQAERDARAALEAQVRAEAAARQTAEAQLLALEEARIRQEEEVARQAEQARLHALVCASASAVLQTAWRRSHASRRFARLRLAVLSLQAHYRGRAVRNLLIKQRLCACILQSVWRQRRMERMLGACQVAATKIQTAWRASFQRRQYAAYALSVSQEMAATSALVESLRQHKQAVEQKAATTVARWFKRRLMGLKLRRLVRGFRRLQACFRAQITRRAANASVQDMRVRLQQADARARADPSLRLGQQTLASLSVLQSSKSSISLLLKACETLELSTQLSAHCCQAFAQAQASHVLIALIRSCNRSTPHQEILRHALVGLLNVARQPHLAAAVAQCSEATDVLVDLLQMFRDKKSIFCLACELLGRLAEACEATKSMCNSADYRKRLDGILSIIERKHRLDARVRSIGDKAGAKDKGVAFVGSPKGRGRFLSEMEPIHGIQHLFFVLTK